MVASALIRSTQVILFLLVVASGIVSLYSATNALAVYSDYSVFLSGIVCLLTAALVGPLFCFFALYGFVYYLDVPVGHAALYVSPVLIAWLVLAGRTLWTRFGAGNVVN